MWTWLPAGWRVHGKAEQIVREETGRDRRPGDADARAPARGAWRRTGRDDIPELFKLRDRSDRPLVLAMTHEEAVTFHVSREVRSYRDLPLILYHVQTKERDEPRPRAGVLRTREFIMKDSYSFDRDEGRLDESYDSHVAAYDRICDRAGLRWYRVESDVGMMAASAPTSTWRPARRARTRSRCRRGLCGQHRGRQRRAAHARSAPSQDEPEPVETPARTIDQVSGLLGIARDFDQVATCRHARRPHHARAGAGRPPHERDQAPERARRRPSAPRTRTRSPSDRPARVHRPGRGSTCRCSLD